MNIWDSIRRDSQDRVRDLIKHGYDLTTVDKAGDTPLTLASRSGTEDMVRLLLEAGVDPDFGPCFPLSAACANGRLSSVKVLLEAGANVNRGHPLTGTPLINAAVKKYADIVMFLLRNGADVNATNSAWMTALHWAALLGLVNMAQCLVRHGADLIPSEYFQYPDRFTPLAHAAHHDHLEMVKYLIGKMEEQGVAGSDRGLALCAAAGSGHVEIINLLLEHGWHNMELPKGSSPLLYAIAHAQPTIAELFLSRGADVQATFGREKKTALHFAALWGQVRLLRNLIRRGANFEARTKTEGETPLHVASKNRYPSYGLKLVRALLNAGADIASRRNDGRNILHLAASVGNVPLLGRALRHGIDPDSKTVRGLTPLAIAAEYGQLGSISILLRWGASIDARCNENCTPLHVAVVQGQWPAVGLLVENGSSLDLLNSRGYSPLQEAREHGHKAAETILLQAGAAENSRPETACVHHRNNQHQIAAMKRTMILSIMGTKTQLRAKSSPLAGWLGDWATEFSPSLQLLQKELESTC
ncbi:unnamed protein product [Clonostachys rhizophaga]|uniref:protein S-acyltransferase n=1 Tax=Clonostachys rhizophaga TaxID=160324 RepID=A0A9N9VWU5_9HYPO|nr:unnamed protein product [Clonostachys rhizophaga]